ncbi:glycerol-3-phosphate ABC transporter [Mesobaculum littorinae]|uniref:Glycerol-3-phosphate ABC transporter n=1 Tax=Mesobaculum littorinae TaxID=2486419 RepID=A0A438ALD7_9RHOB|nr:DUF2160 domain-containing protein [Mesobaculum littorinae]RVV99663.1 glycerol-3-phosphate ABC transporter [Mesobaculum littorinae]
MAQSSHKRGGAGLIAGLVAPWLAVGGVILWAALRASGEDSAFAWTQSLNPGGWMAWVFPTALFFWIVAGLLVLFSILAIRAPETPRRGILRIETTRGDRLFIALLVAGFVNLAWLALGLGPQWAALVACAILAAAIFRLV